MHRKDPTKEKSKENLYIEIFSITGASLQSIISCIYVICHYVLKFGYIKHP